MDVLRAVVTVRTGKTKRDHADKKIEGMCPIGDGIVFCTDTEALVHSYIETGNSFEEIRQKAKDKHGQNVVRIEGFNEKFLSS